jgi:membrane protein implicated in regulation of membrane protease activity
MVLFNSLVEMSEYLGYIWLIAGLIFLLLEVGTPGLFFFVSLALGSFVGAITAFIGHSIMMQCWSAVIGSLFCFFILKNIFANKQQPGHKTNIQALIGKTAIIIESIEPNKAGRIKIKGEEWPATNDQKMTLPLGKTVTIIRIEGNKVVVR